MIRNLSILDTKRQKGMGRHATQQKDEERLSVNMSVKKSLPPLGTLSGVVRFWSSVSVPPFPIPFSSSASIPSRITKQKFWRCDGLQSACREWFKFEINIAQV